MKRLPAWIAAITIILLPLIVSSEDVKLEWDNSTSPHEGTEIFWAVSTNHYDHENLVILPKGDTNTTISNLVVGVTYKFIARHVRMDAAGNVVKEGPASNELVHTVQLGTPGPPVLRFGGNIIINITNIVPPTPNGF